MRYLCLVYADENVVHSVPDRECVAYDEGLRESGHCVASEALEAVETAKTVRVRDGKVSITDGPFAETKEQLGGFYLIEARDLDEAIEVAARIPPARVGSIEIRPIRPIRESVRAADPAPIVPAELPRTRPTARPRSGRRPVAPSTPSAAGRS